MAESKSISQIQSLRLGFDYYDRDAPGSRCLISVVVGENRNKLRPQSLSLSFSDNSGSTVKSSVPKTDRDLRVASDVQEPSGVCGVTAVRADQGVAAVIDQVQ